MRVESDWLSPSPVLSMGERRHIVFLFSCALLLCVSPLVLAHILSEKLMLISLLPSSWMETSFSRVLHGVSESGHGLLVTTTPDFAIGHLREHYRHLARQSPRAERSRGGDKSRGKRSPVAERFSLQELAEAWGDVLEAAPMPGRRRQRPAERGPRSAGYPRARRLFALLMRQPEASVEPAGPSSSSSGGPRLPDVVVVTHFWPSLEERELIDLQIGALSTLMDHQIHLLVVSRLDPRDLETAGQALHRSEAATDARERWAAFLARFVIYYGHNTGVSMSTESELSPPVNQAPMPGILRSESRGSQHLEKIGALIHAELGRADREEQRKDLASAPGHSARRARAEGRDENEEPDDRLLEYAAPRQIVSQVGHMARAYYHAIWVGCRTDERVVLYQLAKDGVVNPKNYGVVSDLLLKGLVIRRPNLRMMNHSFGRFVLNTVDRATLVQWEEEVGTSAWSVFKWLLPLPLLLLGGYLFVTQPSAFSNVVGLVVAVGSVLPTFHNLFEYFQTLSARREVEAARSRGEGESSGAREGSS
ncbi:MAG: hypothetical protein MI919_18630 [Holophagales bacterium]|nr:hypothetical protein [Holophagales bacterium]